MTEEKSINQQISTGAIWMVGARFAVKGISLVSMMILARLLMPEDFGIIALASSIYAFIELMRAMGFDTVLIQKQNCGREHYDTAWSLQIIFSSFAAAMMFLIAPFVTSYYDDSRLQDVLYVMAGMTFLNGFANIGVVEFRKKMSFNKDFTFQVLVKLSGFLVTIPLAFYLRNYWAMLMGMLSTRIFTVALSYYMHSYRPRLNLSQCRDILGFSSWLFLNNILVFLNQNSQNLIVGKLLGGSAVGLLSVTGELSNMTTNEVIAPINRAAYPGYAKVANDKKLLKDAYLSVLAYVAILSTIAGFCISATAPILVPVLLGDKWLDGIPLIEIISLTSAFMALNTNSGSIYLATGKPKIITFLMITRLTIVIPLMFFLVEKTGLIGIAYAYVIGAIFLFPLSQFVALKQLDIRWLELFSIIYRPLLSASLMLFSFRCSVLGEWLFSITEYQFINLVVSLGASLFITSALIILFWFFAGKPDGAERQIGLKFSQRWTSQKI